MKNFIKNIVLLIVAVVFAYYTAGYFGLIYRNIFPESVGGAWIGSRGSWDVLNGLPFSLLFFFSLFSYKLIFKSKQSVLWLLSPLLLFEVASDLIHIYIPIILIILAFALNNFVGFLIKKIKHPNPPIVIK